MIEKVKIPVNMEINYSKGNLLLKSKLGELNLKVPNEVAMRYESSYIYIYSDNKPLAGTFISILKTKLKGVTQGYTLKLQLVGIGFRFIEASSNLKFKIGFSHKMVCKIPENLTVTIIKPTLLSISGTNYELIHNFADLIRSLKKPENYKGKGIRYLDEKVHLKEAKKK